MQRTAQTEKTGSGSIAKSISKLQILIQSGNCMLQFTIVKISPTQDVNLILGQAHFIKSAEDLYEALVNSVPNVKFGLGFCESSGPCLVRIEGNDPELQKLAGEKAFELGCGHSFLIFLRNAYPLNVLDKIKAVPEVCIIFAATANPLEVVIAETDQGRGIVGVVDGFRSKGIETEVDVKERREFLRKIGYKL
jgi:adenosine/AMP kinase